MTLPKTHATRGRPIRDRTQVLIFGWKQRPHQRRRDGARLERVLDESAYDLTVFKVHFGPLTLKLYDKGARVLRVEAIVHNVRALRCGRSVEKLSIMLHYLNLQRELHRTFQTLALAA